MGALLLWLFIGAQQKGSKILDTGLALKPRHDGQGIQYEGAGIWVEGWSRIGEMNMLAQFEHSRLLLGCERPHTR